MRKIGVEPTNSKEGDHAAITSKLDEMESIAKTDAEHKKVHSLKDEFAALISAANGAGMSQIASMNRFFIVS